MMSTENKLAQFRHALGTAIRRRRKEKRFTQRRFASMVGTSAAAISAWETGKAEPQSRSMRKVCEVFGVQAAELFEKVSRSIGIPGASEFVDEGERSVGGIAPPIGPPPPVVVKLGEKNFAVATWNENESAYTIVRPGIRTARVAATLAKREGGKR